MMPLPTIDGIGNVSDAVIGWPTLPTNMRCTLLAAS